MDLLKKKLPLSKLFLNQLVDQKGQISNTLQSDLKRLISFIYKSKSYLREKKKTYYVYPTIVQHSKKY